jgi:DNA-binding MarR family transcriptional regulator
MSLDSQPAARARYLLRWPIYSMALLYLPASARLDAALGEIGLSRRTYQVMVTLREFGGLSQQEVSDSIKVDRSDMVRILDRLEELGYVVRVRDAADRRRHILTLTPAGQEAIERAEPVLARVTEETFARVSDEERRTLHRLVLQALGESTAVMDQPPPRDHEHGETATEEHDETASGEQG